MGLGWWVCVGLCCGNGVFFGLDDGTFVLWLVFTVCDGCARLLLDGWGPLVLVLAV